MSFEKEYTLDPAGIDALSREINEWLKRADVSRENALRIRITMEELLLRIMDHFGETASGTLLMKKRFGRPTLRFRYGGEKYDPTREKESEEDEVIREMMTWIGLAPEWRYIRGVNELILRGPGVTIKSEMLLAGAGICAVLFGIAGGWLPGAVRDGLTDYLLTPVSDTFLNGLNTFVGLMIFISVVSGICSIGSIAEFSKMGKYVILRQMLLTFIFAAISLVALPVFGVTFGEAAGGASQTSMIIDILFSIVPSDPISPFAEKNMLQIIFLAVMTGIGLLLLEERGEKIRAFLLEMVELLSEIISVVCRFLPLYIFTSLSVFVLENGIGVFARLWKPVVLTMVLCVLFLAVKMLYAAVKYHVPAGLLLKKTREPMLTGFFTASSAAAFGQMTEALEGRLGVSPAFYRFALPFVNLLSGETSSATIIVIVCHLARMQGTPVNLSWILTVWFMGAIFSMAMPPVSGAFLVCIGAIMAQLGMGDSGLAMAGLLGIVCDFFNTGARIGIELMELVLQADHLKKLDRNILERSI